RAAEALCASPALLPAPRRSRIAGDDPLRVGDNEPHQGHLIIDFGDDEMTQGRAHPMIDPSLRMERIAAESADPTCGVLLLDLVLGHGAHPDPADDLANAIRSARTLAHAEGRALPVVVSLTGTEEDPQGYARTAETLAGAGASVFLSNAAAARHTVAALSGSTLPGSTSGGAR